MAAKKHQECATREIELSKLEVNRGQLYGLPKNPRFIRDDRFESLKKSIRDDPEMLSLRELLVYPLESGNFLVIGGNMRLRACEELGYEALPCKVLPVDTPVAKLRAYVVKDNVAFGENDWDAFANEWDLDELKVMGLELDGACIEQGEGAEEVDAESFDGKIELKFKFSLEQADFVRNELRKINENSEAALLKILGYVEG